PLVAWNDSIYNIRSDFSLASGGDCKAQLKLNTNSYAYQLQTAITKFSIGILYPYLKDYLKVKSLDGLVDANMHISGNFNHPTEIAA
ncbi:hypothetical protein ABTK03_20735, partial [Acinetobacter baumannii]